MRIRLVLNYDGAGFVGWQRQRSGGSVQDCVEDAIFRLCGERVSIGGSGRTDTGVHALNQVAHFDLVKDFDATRIAAGLNFYLPQTVRVSSAEAVDATFHSRGSARSKTYVYLMYKSYFDNALFDGRALKISSEADVAKMKKAAAHFVGTHDFFAFMSAGSSAKTSVRTIFESEIIELDSGFGGSGLGGKIESAGQCNCKIDGRVENSGHRDFRIDVRGESAENMFGSFVPPLVMYKVRANGFLYNMVRKITACILRAGTGKIDPDDVPALIEAKDRLLTKDTAKAYGLYLYGVEY